MPIRHPSAPMQAALAALVEQAIPATFLDLVTREDIEPLWLALADAAEMELPGGPQLRIPDDERFARFHKIRESLPEEPRRELERLAASAHSRQLALQCAAFSLGMTLGRRLGP